MHVKYLVTSAVSTQTNGMYAVDRSRLIQAHSRLNQVNKFRGSQHTNARRSYPGYISCASVMLRHLRTLVRILHLSLLLPVSLSPCPLYPSNCWRSLDIYIHNRGDEAESGELIDH